MKRILITGASGFIGSQATEKFRRDGWDVIGIGRRPLPDDRYLQIDLSQAISPAACQRIGPVDVILHTAARSSPWGTRKQFSLANVSATAHVLDLAEKLGRPKLIFVSSSSVYYRAEDQFQIAEITPVAANPVNHYAASKQAAEQLVRGYQGRYCILRPRAVYGRGDTVLFPRILAAARAGRLPLLVRQGEPAVGDLLSIENLLHCFARAAEDDRIIGEFNLTDNQPIQIEQFLLSIFDKLGIARPTRCLSVKTAFRAAYLLEKLYGTFLPWIEPPITRFGVHVFAFSKTFNVEKMLNFLGLQSRPLMNRYPISLLGFSHPIHMARVGSDGCSFNLLRFCIRRNFASEVRLGLQVHCAMETRLFRCENRGSRHTCCHDCPAHIVGRPLLQNTLLANVQQLSNATKFLWMIDTVDREAQEIAENIRSIHPSAADRIQVQLCEQSPNDCNPKTWKLAKALSLVTTDALVVLDDDTTIDCDSIGAAIASLERYDLYTGLPTYKRAKNFCGDLVTHFVNSNSILTYLPPLEIFPPLTINGMFYVARTSTLRAIDAFRAIQHELCDDYALHKHFSKNDKSVVQGVSVQSINTSIETWESYFRLMHRWNLFAIILIRDLGWVQQFVLFLFLGLPSLLLISQIAFAAVSLNVLAMLVLFGVLVLRMTTISLLQYLVVGHVLSMNWISSVVAELLQPVHVLRALFDSQITWRNRKIKLGPDRRFVIKQGAQA